MDVKVKFDADKTESALKKLPYNTLEHVRRALIESCTMVHTGAVSRHRFISRTGDLERKAIVFNREENIDMSKLQGTIEISNLIAPYGKFVHEGTRPHDIYAKNKKLLRFVVGNRFVSTHKVHHPGTKPDQFLYESAERSRGKINEIFLRHNNQAIKEAGL